MLKRTITAIVAIAIFIPICIYSDTAVFPAAMALLSAVAAYEMLSCIGVKKEPALLIPALLFAAVTPVIPYFSADSAVALIFAAAIVLLILVFANDVFSRGRLDFTLSASAFTGIFYIGAAFSSIVLLRGSGKYLYLLVFIGPWVSDTFAYLCGRLFGKHKLIPEVSPKKTVEGSIGGILFAAGAFVLYAFIIKRFFAQSSEPNYVVLAVSGALVSVISQIGDLAASVIKRRFGVKDYGWLFPGHGGVMDRFDSVLLTAPVVYIISQIPALSGILL